jgi:hypothetical protein
MPRVPHLPSSGVYAYQNVFIQGTGKLLSCKLWWVGSAPPGSGYDPRSANDALYAGYKTALQNCISNQCNLPATQLSVRNAMFEYSDIHYRTDAGMISSPNLPDDMCVILRRQSDQAGPSGRGRIRMPGVPESFVNGNYLSGSTANTNMAALTTALFAPVANQGITWSSALFSSHLGAMHTLIAWHFDDLIYTSRRRRPRL